MAGDLADLGDAGRGDPADLGGQGDDALGHGGLLAARGRTPVAPLKGEARDTVPSWGTPTGDALRAHPDGRRQGVEARAERQQAQVIGRPVGAEPHRPHAAHLGDERDSVDRTAAGDGDG
ncbi:MAG: hypothetical protein ACK559_00150, partial [bacterium]